MGSPRWTLTAESLPPRPAALGLATAIGTHAATTDAVLTVPDLSKRFGSLVVAANVNLEVRTGILHSVIGPNGAGKTTLFNMLTGLLVLGLLRSQRCHRNTVFVCFANLDTIPPL